MGVSTFQTEYQALQKVSGDSGATSLVAFKRILNDALDILCDYGDWPWLKYRGAVNLVPAYSTGTVTIVDDTTDYMTTTGTWSTAWSPVRVRTAAGHDYLLTYNSGNSRWEMDRSFVVAESGVTYTLYKDTYALPVRLRSLYLGWETVTTQYPLDVVTEPQMQVARSGPFATRAVPVRLCLVEPDSSNQVSQMFVDPPPAEARSVHYRGYRVPADLSADADTLLFAPTVLPVFRRLARSLLWEYRGNLDRAADERSKYEIDIRRLWDKSDPMAGAQDRVELSPSHFRPAPRIAGEIGYDDIGGW